MNYIDVIAGIIIKDNKVLIARRSKGFLKGKWEFPGGKKENNESHKNCLKREFKEEFNIDIEVGKFYFTSQYDYENIKIKLHTYLVNDYRGNIQMKDHDKICWANKNELKNFEYAPADIPIIKKIIREE